MLCSLQQLGHCGHLEKEAGDQCCGLVSIYPLWLLPPSSLGLQQEQGRDSDGVHRTKHLVL